MLPEKKLSDFCEINKFEHLILKPTCFKGLLPSTIDLLLTNHKQKFYEIGCVRSRYLTPPQDDHLGSKESFC